MPGMKNGGAPWAARLGSQAAPDEAGGKHHEREAGQRKGGLRACVAVRKQEPGIMPHCPHASVDQAGPSEAGLAHPSRKEKSTPANFLAQRSRGSADYAQRGIAGDGKE